MRPRSALLPHQLHSLQRMVETGEQAVFMPVGAGKTATSLTALKDLDATEAVVFAPAKVVELNEWGKEAARWEHLQQLNVVPVVGSPAQRLKLVQQPGIKVVSYNNALWLTEEVDLDFKAVVFDELSQVKAPGTKRFRRLRARAKEIPIRFGLTGSPLGNHLLDIWGELYMVAGEKPLGPRFVDFRSEHFIPDFHQRVWTPRHDARDRILRAIEPYAFSLQKSAVPGTPRQLLNLIDTPLPRSVRIQAEQLAADCAVKLKSGVELKALSASALAVKLRQFASGAVYTDPLTDAWTELHDAKIEATRAVIEEQQGEPIIIYYWFQHELERLKQAFPHARDARESPALEEWMMGEVEVLLAHPASVGYGLNLQRGGFSILWFTLPWSHELWEQANARLARPGQWSPFVVVNVLMAGEADAMVLRALDRKGDLQQTLVDHLDISRRLL